MAVDPGEWSVKHVLELCQEGEEERLSEATLSLVDPESISSVWEAVDHLNRGVLDCSDGFCVVFSAKKRIYHLVYLPHLKEAALAACGPCFAPRSRRDARGFMDRSTRSPRRPETSPQRDSSRSPLRSSRSPPLSARSSPFGRLQERERSQPKRPEERERSPRKPRGSWEEAAWTSKQVFRLGAEGQPLHLEGNVMILDSNMISVGDAVTALNADLKMCPEGICVVYSYAKAGYFMLYRRGMKEESVAKRRILEGHAVQDTSLVSNSSAASMLDTPTTTDLWTTRQVIRVCKVGAEWRFEGRARLLHPQHVTSVAGAVDALNQDRIACPEGFCVVYSASKKAYYLLYRTGCREESLGSCVLTDEAWSPKQVAFIGQEGVEDTFDGRAWLLDRSVVASVNDAARMLNEEEIHCPTGYCVVFSSSRQSYFLLYRSDKREDALMALGMDSGKEVTHTLQGTFMSMGSIVSTGSTRSSLNRKSVSFK